MSEQAQKQSQETESQIETCKAEVHRISEQIIDLAYQLNGALDHLRAAQHVEGTQPEKNN